MQIFPLFFYPFRLPILSQGTYYQLFIEFLIKI